MHPFTVHTGLAAPLDRPNVDTDQIIPKQFLKRIERTGFGQFLFYDWRLIAASDDPEGERRLNPNFELNQDRYAGAGVLLAGRNFGCGSSREHAVWALHDYGFRAVVAPSFADIFYNNALGNGLLPVTLPEDAVADLLQRTRANENYRLTVDLERCEIRDEQGARYPFTIDPFHRHRLLRGLDDVGLTLQAEDAIAAYERVEGVMRYT